VRVTYNWLKDFVEIKIPAQALADKLTMAGLEVTSLEARDGDFVFEIEITSNRPDWLSVMGIAREVAAITGKKFGTRFSVLGSRKSPPIPPFSKGGSGGINSEYRTLSIYIENKKDCPLYTAKIIRDVKVGPSPDWLKNRLELIGCRSINSIVDITNYILFTWGEPLHAFDLDKLAGNQLKIITRRAKKGEKLVTIDGVERLLDENILIIAHDEKPIAVAGIMGGKDSEVTSNTKNILLEAALFNPILIRRSRQKLGIQTDSSYRFERGIAPETVEFSSCQAAKLIAKLALGKCVLAKACGFGKTKKKNVTLNPAAVNKLLGTKIAPAKIKNILKKIPTERQDINSEVDLIEEVARIYGYENIPTKLPAVNPRTNCYITKSINAIGAGVKPQVTISQAISFVSLIKNILTGLGLNEVITYSLIDKNLLERTNLKPGSEIIEILNPLSKEQEILRPQLIPSLERVINYNLNQKQNCINIFEVAKIFSAHQAPSEELTLGIALCGEKTQITEDGLVKETLGLMHLKGVLEELFKQLGINDYNFVRESTYNTTISVKGENLGFITILAKNIFAAELSLDKISAYLALEKKFAPLPKYPAVARDISFIIKDGLLIQEILDTAKEKGRPLLDEIKIVDFYKGKQIPDGYRGFTISCSYRLNERTLTEAEINPTHKLICNALTEHFHAKIR